MVLPWTGLLAYALEVRFTMRQRFALGAIAVAAVALSTAVAGDALKSGLQVGASPTPFHPLNINGPFAGKKQCLV